MKRWIKAHPEAVVLTGFALVAAGFFTWIILSLRSSSESEHRSLLHTNAVHRQLYRQEMADRTWCQHHGDIWLSADKVCIKPGSLVPPQE